MKPVFILTGGGTAGHIIPNLALVPYLQDAFSLHYVGSNEGMERALVEKAGLPFHAIPVVKFDRAHVWKNLSLPCKLHKAKRAAKKLLDELEPVGVFGKGGYVSLPVVLAAKCPVFIHESDYSLGLANRLSAGKAETVFTSFPSAAEGRKNGLCCGSILRREIYLGDRERARKISGLTAPKPYLLIVGGSSGAKAVNDCVYACLDALTAKFNVIHVTGAKNAAQKVARPDYYAVPYTDAIADFMRLADVVVTRGGSGVLFELAALHIPALIVPLPKGVSRGDQVLNARYFTEKGYAATLDQSAMTPATLPAAVEQLYADRMKYIENLRHGVFDGTKTVVDRLLLVSTKRDTALR